MDAQTITKNFQSIIGDESRVLAAMFTTYNFEPDFFEQEIIPLMLDQELAFSSDARIKSIQVREALSAADLPIEVFYDQGIFRDQGTISPSMEYLHHGVHGERSAFHAKLIFLLIDESGKKSLWVGSGSANLTNAGWWENIECQHWECVRSGEVNRRFLNQLRADVDWLASRRKQTANENKGALSMLADYLTQCRGSNSAGPVFYYGLASLALGHKRRPAFMKFLMDALKDPYIKYKHWSLEIISPYFAEKPGFTGHEFFFEDMEVDQIRLFLPENDQGEALCHKEYFEQIENTDGLEWAKWAPDVVKKLGLEGDVLRKTHAKVYHFYNGVQSWVFVGSVNFTHRAIGDNQEAGFFTKLPYRTELLIPIKSAPEKWCPEEDLPTQGDKGEDRSLPDLIFTYDWKKRLLHAVVGEEQLVVANILSPERAVKVRDVHVSDQPSVVACEPDTIESMLSGSGFLWVTGKWEKEEKSFPEHKVLVQQINWTHKPLDLPRLSPEEIMQIYAGLSHTRRNQVIEHLKERQLREMGLRGEVAGSIEYEDQGRQFFAEYAELLHAFRNLRKRLHHAWSEGHENQVDYYLSGRGMDSLPTLLESLYEKDRQLDAVTVYLTLLCLIQIYECPDYAKRPQVLDRLKECKGKLKALEGSGDLRLINGDAQRSKNFFKWYKEQFFRVYRQLDIEVSE